MKKRFLISALILSIACITVFIYNKTFTIPDDKKQIEDSIKSFMTNPINNLEIKQMVDINNKKIVLFNVNNSLANAELTKGINNKYKIEYVESSGSFRYYVHKTNKGKYFVIKSKNQDMKISYMKVFLDGIEYKIDIPQQEYYIAYCKVSDKTEAVFPSLDEIKLYDKDDIEITDEVFKKLFS